jgi:hypothetical protein
VATGASNDTAYPGVENYIGGVDLCFTGRHRSLGDGMIKVQVSIQMMFWNRPSTTVSVRSGFAPTSRGSSRARRTGSRRTLRL